MTLREIKEKLALGAAAGEDKLDREVKGGYAGDLLSDVIAHSKKDDLWITLQIHPNIVAVAALRELAAILIVNDRNPDKETIQVAEKEGIPLLTTSMTAFEVSGTLSNLGISGKR